MSARGGRRPAARRSEVLGQGDLATSLLLVFPLFLAYQVGILFTPAVNGVDFLSGWVFELVGGDRQRYILLHLGLLIAFLVLLLYLRRRRGFSYDVLPPMLLESSIYALTLGSLIVFVIDDLLGIQLAILGWDALLDLELAATGQAVVVALGAGVHEELVFRLGLMSGVAALLVWLRVRLAVAVALAVLTSSLLFSAAHHIGPLGDPWQLGVFLYRFLAGVVFAAIFYFRSLAHAVYTHFLYDVYVLVIRA